MSGSKSKSLVIPQRDPQLYEHCSLGAIPTSGVSSQCPDTGSMQLN
ncbi:MAG: hypothetical protein ACEY3L_12000 [Wolbachia sp.]|nr:MULTISPECIES: hypothetical protein [unclassified Wolbachia]